MKIIKSDFVELYLRRLTNMASLKTNFCYDNNHSKHYSNPSPKINLLLSSPCHKIHITRIPYRPLKKLNVLFLTSFIIRPYTLSAEIVITTMSYNKFQLHGRKNRIQTRQHKIIALCVLLEIYKMLHGEMKWRFSCPPWHSLKFFFDQLYEWFRYKSTRTT